MTFAQGKRKTVGKPPTLRSCSRQASCSEVVRGHLRVVAFQDGFLAQPRPVYVQRICAILRRRTACGQPGAGGRPALLRVGWLIRYNRGFYL